MQFLVVIPCFWEMLVVQIWRKKQEVLPKKTWRVFFDSLRNKIMPLADDVIVYPAHGAGSSCGKNLSKETVDTLGNQKETNYALRADMTKEEFIKEVTDGLTPPPQYFPLNVKMNKEGYDDFADVLERGRKHFLQTNLKQQQTRQKRLF